MEGELIQVERYVSMVLSYLRLDSESSDFVFARQPLEPIVRGVVRKLARLFVLKNISLDLPPLELTVLTDSKWLGLCAGAVADPTPSNIRRSVGALPCAWRGARSFFRIAALAFAPRTCPEFLKRGLPAATAGKSSIPPDWDCTCAAAYWTSWATLSAFPRPLARVPGWSWISATNTRVRVRRCHCKKLQNGQGEALLFPQAYAIIRNWHILAPHKLRRHMSMRR